MRQSRRSSGSTFAAGLLLLLGLAGIGIFTYRTRADAINDSVANSTKIATILQFQLEAAVDAIDHALIGLQQRIFSRNPQSPDEFLAFVRSDEFAELAQQRRAMIPQAYSFVVTDAAGAIQHSTTAPKAGLLTEVRDRDYFQSLRNQSNDRLVISEPVKNKLSGADNIVFARRLTNQAGTFLGVVFIPVTMTYFQQIYAPLASIKDMRFLLLRLNGTVLVRFPDTIDRTGLKMPPQSAWYRLVAEGGGYYHSPGYFDGSPLLVAVRLFEQYPLVLDISETLDSALQRWHERAFYNIGGALAFLICTLLLFAAVRRQFRDLARSEENARLSQIAAHKNAEALQKVNAQLDVALENMPQGLCMFDSAQRVVVANARYAAMYHLELDDVAPGRTMQHILERRLARNTLHVASVQDYARDFFAADKLAESLPDGRMIRSRVHRLKDGGWLTTHADVTDEHRRDSQMAFMARHDLLTGLFNRASFSEKIQEAGTRLRRSGEPFSVLLLDLDRFKQVNDTMGHPAGDALLREAARRLKTSLRETDVLARLGGDEFAIIQTGTTQQRDDVVAFANRIFACLSDTVQIEGQEISISTSIGIALAPEHGTLPETLIKRADLALYRSKGRGRGVYTIFSEELETNASARQQMETDLRRGVENDELELYYQPIIDARTRRACAAEALARWRHPQRGMISPSEFIPLAEDVGLIEQIGQWVLLRACTDAMAWPNDVKVAVNLSPAQFRKGNLLNSVLYALVESGLPPERLELEITETVLLDAELAHSGVVRQLKNLGVSIALDDFGTGYSSLSYLTMFPFDKIKIDKSFTNSLDRADCSAIVASIVTLARGLDMETTAEGVETELQCELLRAAGVSSYQGYFFGQPGPADALDFGSKEDELEAVA